MEKKDQYEQLPAAKYECLLFDVDDTLYPLSSGISREITKNIEEYMIQKLGIDEEKVPEMCISLYKNYGTTMAGLRAIGYNFDYDDFHKSVHGRLPYHILRPDPVLRTLLLSLPVRKVIFTNADKIHANRVLNSLGLEDCFEDIISFDTLNPTDKGKVSVKDSSTEISDDSSNGHYEVSEESSRLNSGLLLPKTPVVCKPFEDAYEEVFKIANINPQKTLFFDDSIRNLKTGKSLGLHTVWVGTSQRIKGVDHALESIHNMREALPELWDAKETSVTVEYSRKVSIETSVIA